MHGIFPKLMKHNKVNPVSKSGSKYDSTNYSHISILPVMSKIKKIF